MRLTAADVMEQTFRIAFRGFDPVEVDAFLQRVADELDRLQEERDRLARELEEEKRARKTLEEALAAARTLQEGILEKARQEAELVVEQARIRADRILAEANEQLVALRRQVEAIRERRALWLGEVEGLAQTLAAWARERREGGPGGPELIAEDGGQPPPAPETAGDDPDAGA